MEGKVFLAGMIMLYQKIVMIRDGKNVRKFMNNRKIRMVLMEGKVFLAGMIMLYQKKYILVH